MSAVVLEVDGAYLATCGECPFTQAYPTEAVATRRAAAHDARHIEWEGTLAIMKRVNDRPPQPVVHEHSRFCTSDLCGSGPSRAELIAATKRRRGSS